MHPSCTRRLEQISTHWVEICSSFIINALEFRMLDPLIAVIIDYINPFYNFSHLFEDWPCDRIRDDIAMDVGTFGNVAFFDEVRMAMDFGAKCYRSGSAGFAFDSGEIDDIQLKVEYDWDLKPALFSALKNNRVPLALSILNELDGCVYKGNLLEDLLVLATQQLNVPVVRWTLDPHFLKELEEDRLGFLWSNVARDLSWLKRIQEFIMK
jgi:hypothetical protein